MMVRRLSMLGVMLLAAGCASTVPVAIRTAPGTRLAVAEVQQHPDAFVGQRVRWGGNILAVNNRAAATEVEVLSRPLSDGGEPQADAPSQGRFIVEIPGFLEPAEYPKDRMFTATGRVVRTEKRRVGDYRYTYPVVQPEKFYLWPKPVDHYPYWYPDPWYDPWYSPWGRPWPYWW